MVSAQDQLQAAAVRLSADLRAARGAVEQARFAREEAELVAYLEPETATAAIDARRRLEAAVVEHDRLHAASVALKGIPAGRGAGADLRRWAAPIVRAGGENSAPDA